MDSRAILAMNLKRLRARRGLTQADLATLTGFSDVQIGRLETGKSGISSEALDKLAAALGVHHVELFRSSEEGQNLTRIEEEIAETEALQEALSRRLGRLKEGTPAQVEVAAPEPHSIHRALFEKVEKTPELLALLQEVAEIPTGEIKYVRVSVQARKAKLSFDQGKAQGDLLKKGSGD